MSFLQKAGLLLALLTLGCGPGGGRPASFDDEPPQEAHKTAQTFGEHILKGDWNAAYAMTTPQFQAVVSQAQLQADYDRLIGEIRQDDPQFKPNMVEVDYGDLPEDEQDAKQGYELAYVPPRDTWRAWMFSEIGFGDGETIERGIDAMLLVIEEGGQMKIAHAEFDFMD